MLLLQLGVTPVATEPSYSLFLPHEAPPEQVFLRAELAPSTRQALVTTKHARTPAAFLPERSAPESVFLLDAPSLPDRDQLF